LATGFKCRGLKPAVVVVVLMVARIIIHNSRLNSIVSTL
jgi:hypothetical protein